MKTEELITWNRLLALDFDAADAALPFSARLARDNDWAERFAARAIDEYRKFCFLAKHAGHAVTPSDEIDQVWHLHLLYSRHYWRDLCDGALAMPLHHGPTRGGGDEDRKYRNWYAATLESYRRYFGEPPADLWPATDERFEGEFVRVDRRRAVVVDRAVLKRSAIAAFTVGGVFAVARALAQNGGIAPSDPAVKWGLWIAAIVFVAFLVARRGRNRPRTRRRSLPRRRPTRGSRGAAAAGGVGCSGSASKGGAKGDGNGSSGDGGPVAGGASPADGGGGTAGGDAGGSGGGGGGGGGGGCGGGGCGGS